MGLEWHFSSQISESIQDLRLLTLLAAFDGEEKGSDRMRHLPHYPANGRMFEAHFFAESEHTATSGIIGHAVLRYIDGLTHTIAVMENGVVEQLQSRRSDGRPRFPIMRHVMDEVEAKRTLADLRGSGISLDIPS